MANYTITGSITNNNSFSVNAIIYIRTYSATDSLISTPYSSTEGEIAGGGSQAINVSFELDTISAANFSYAQVYCYFTKSGYADSAITQYKLVKPTTGTGAIYGVEWTNNSSTTMTRTDDAVGMTYSINSTTGEITSDFNAVFPFNEIVRETDSDGNIWVNVPAMYFRITTDSSNNITGVAVSNTLHDEGTWYGTKAFSVSAYGASGSSGAMKSVSGVSRLANISITDLRTYIKNTNSNYTMLDLYTKTILDFLWWIEFATKNSQSVMTGYTSQSGTSHSSAISTGGTDGLTTPSGYNPSTLQMRWHYIEDFIGNMYEWLDGLYRPGTTVYYTSNISNYSDSTTSKSSYAAASDSNWIYAWHWDTNNPFLVVPSTTNSTEGGFSDYWYAGSSSYPVVLVGATFGRSTSSRGLVYFDRGSASAADFDVGGRLIKHT